jgi:hypothetical protein
MLPYEMDNKLIMEKIAPAPCIKIAPIVSKTKIHNDLIDDFHDLLSKGVGVVVLLFCFFSVLLLVCVCVSMINIVL